LIHVSDLSARLLQDVIGSMGKSVRLRLIALAVVLAASGFAVRANADPRDHDRAREAVTRGEIRPLAEILGAVRGKLPGEVAGVEIEQKNGRWMYEFRVFGKDGRLFEVYVDGQTAEIQRVKEK
jgi:uncharacterized membrane protein YkoI